MRAGRRRDRLGRFVQRSRNGDLPVVLGVDFGRALSAEGVAYVLPYGYERQLWPVPDPPREPEITWTRRRVWHARHFWRGGCEMWFARVDGDGGFREIPVKHVRAYR